MQDAYREWVYNEIFRAIRECARRRSAAFTPTWATPLGRAGRGANERRQGTKKSKPDEQASIQWQGQ